MSIRIDESTNLKGMIVGITAAQKVTLQLMNHIPNF